MAKSLQQNSEIFMKTAEVSLSENFKAQKHIIAQEILWHYRARKLKQQASPEMHLVWSVQKNQEVLHKILTPVHKSFLNWNNPASSCRAT